MPYGSIERPCAATAAKARVISISRTSEVPSTIEGRVLTGVVMPKRRDIDAKEREQQSRGEDAPKPAEPPVGARDVLFTERLARLRARLAESLGGYGSLAGYAGELDARLGPPGLGGMAGPLGALAVGLVAVAA